MSYFGWSDAGGIGLWEEGLNNEAMEHLGAPAADGPDVPSLYRILVTETNVLVPCKLIRTINQYLMVTPQEEPRILVLSGSDHTEGIRKLLKRPNEAFQLLRHL